PPACAIIHARRGYWPARLPYNGRPRPPHSDAPMSDTPANSTPAEQAEANAKTTHFGFQTVKVEETASKVAQVFHSVAARYDLMNDLLSGGVHRLWKRFTIEASAVRPGQTILDIAGGTGDLALQFSRKVGSEGKVVLADINDSMLKVGRDR